MLKNHGVTVAWAAVAVLWCSVGALSCMKPAPAAEVVDGPNGQKAIVLDAGEVAQCKEQGGCVVISKEALKQAIARSCGTQI